MNTGIDSSMYKVPFTNYNCRVVSPIKFNTAINFNNSRICFPQETIIFGDKDFTIDWWQRETTSGITGTKFCSLYTTDSSSYGGMQLGHNGIYVDISSKINSWNLVRGAIMFEYELYMPVHYAVVRHNNTLTSYKNGTLFASTSINGTIFQDSKYDMCIGDYRAGDHDYFIGHIEEFRISDVARWTSNFTPPTKPYR